MLNFLHHYLHALYVAMGEAPLPPLQEFILSDFLHPILTILSTNFLSSDFLVHGGFWFSQFGFRRKIPVYCT